MFPGEAERSGPDCLSVSEFPGRRAATRGNMETALGEPERTAPMTASKWQFYLSMEVPKARPLSQTGMPHWGAALPGWRFGSGVLPFAGIAREDINIHT